MSKLLIKHLRADVKIAEFEDGKPKLRLIGVMADGKTPQTSPAFRIRTLVRGDELPDEMMDGELDRLKSLGAVGTADEVANAEQLANPASDLGEGDDGASAGDGGTGGELDVANIGSYSDEQLVALIGTGVGAKKLVDAVGDNVELATRVIAAEKTATKGDGRATLVGPLEKVAAAGDGGTGGE